MACGRPSVGVRWRPLLSVAIVTQFVTPSPAGRSRATAVTNTLSRSVGMRSSPFMKVCDVGCQSRVVCAERLRTQLTEATNETNLT